MKTKGKQNGGIILLRQMVTSNSGAENKGQQFQNDVYSINHENLYSRKIEEHFKVFIGFKNQLLADFKIERQLNELTN